jgi:hypothetical protein
LFAHQRDLVIRRRNLTCSRFEPPGGQLERRPGQKSLLIAISILVKIMNANEVEVDEYEAIFDFLKEVCTRYHLGKHSSEFDQQAFTDWVVLQAGLLYIQYVLQPESAQC